LGVLWERIEGGGVEGNGEQSACEREANKGGELVAGQKRVIFNEVDTGAADVEDMCGVFAHLADARCGLFVGDEMKVCHFGDGVADRLVNGSFGGITTSDVGDRDAGEQAGLDGGKDFETITKDEDEVGADLFEGICEPDHAATGGFGDVGRGVSDEKHVDLLVNGESVNLDQPPRFTELWSKVHAGHE
jgi:hypothetical protein